MKTRRSVILYYRHNFQEKKKILHVTFFNVSIFAVYVFLQAL